MRFMAPHRDDRELSEFARKSSTEGPGVTCKKALITGVTGQDGSYLAEFLLEKGMLDLVIDRREMKAVIAQALRFMGAPPRARGAGRAAFVEEPRGLPRGRV